jgi:energy-converting hydrogenase Eha subunit A
MTEEHVASTPPATPHNSLAHVLAGIQSLHDRLEAIEDLARAAQDDGPAVASGARVPAWRRPTDGEARWQVALATAVAIALQLPVYGRELPVRPSWVLPAVQGLLLLGIVAANPHRINRQSRLLRSAALALAALLSVANAWSAAAMVSDIVRGKGPATAGPLLVTGGAIWLTNVIIFALWYWEFDQGGPVARALVTKPRYPDFLFANMTVWDNPDLCPRDWKPSFSDYLYLAFTNATAFSPTDTLPLSRWAKMAMTLQSLVSLITVALVVARAVNIL